MYKSLSLFTFVFAVLLGESWGHNCTNAITIENQGLLNYLANVSFVAPHNLSGEWIMDMDTDVEFTFLGVSYFYPIFKIA